MSESKTPPSSPHISNNTHDMEVTVKRTKLSNEKEFPLSKLLGNLILFNFLSFPLLYINKLNKMIVK